MPVSKENFGALDNGQKVQKFILSNENGVIVEVTKFIFLGSAQPHQPVIVFIIVVVIPFLVFSFWSLLAMKLRKYDNNT
jgi:hypothetical protein